MALRINKKEKQLIYSKNASIRRKQERLKKEFNVHAKFKLKNPKDFKTRAELNAYKQDAKVFLLRGTHAYVKGGVVSRYFSEKGIEVPFAIPKDEYLQIKRIINKRNKYVKNQSKMFIKVKYSVRGKKTITRLYTRVLQSYKPEQRLLYKYSSYKPLHFNTEYITSKGTWKKFQYAIKKFQSKESIAKKQLTMKENYMKSLRNTFGSYSEELNNLINKLSVNEFITYYESEQFADFTYIYDEKEALNVIRYLTQHLANFVDQVKPAGVSDIDVEKALEFVNKDNEYIMSEYNKGALGGMRIRLDTNKYIDLTTDEAIQYNLGWLNEKDLFKPQYKARIHYVRTPDDKFKKLHR